MKLFEIQQKISKFVKQKDIETSLQIRVLDLVSEVGELAKEVLKASDYGKKEYCSSESFADELGDVFFSLICLANKQDINLADCLNNTLEKYNQRFENKGRIDSGY